MREGANTWLVCIGAQALRDDIILYYCTVES